MGWSVSWSIPQRIYVVKIEGEITEADFIAGCEKSTEFVREGIAPVHCIIDAKFATIPHVNIAKAREIAQVFNEPKLGWVLMISANPIVRMVGSILSQLSNKRCKFVNTVDEALVLLQRDDLTLQNNIGYVYSR
ncbi:MAG: hypothetical protein AAF846_14890 [Chloroflexota bacterium]